METKYILFVCILICAVLASNSYENETLPVLIFSDTHSIGLFDTESDNVTILADGYNYILFLDYHYSKRYIFWSDYHGNTISRFQYPTDDRPTPEVIININNPTGVAVDPIDDHLYWAVQSNKIYRSNFDGTDSIIIVNDANFPLDLDLDISNRLMFFITASREIWKCKLNGNECSVIVDSTKIAFKSEHIALDLYDNRIYWTYIHQQSPIPSTSLNGTDYRETVASAYQGYGLDVSTTHIYYADWFKGLYRMRKADSTTTSLLYESVVSAMKIFKYEDECFRYTLIKDQEKRSSDFETDVSTNLPISDEYLETSWYRIKSENGDQMPTYPPGAFHCGTSYPIWIKGTLPTVSDGNLTATACLQTENITCETSFNVQIRNCGNYFIYFLQNTTRNAAYCFGNGPVLCPDGLSSESGYYPGCSSSFPTEIVTPYVNASLTVSSSGLVPIFECKFDDIPNGTYVYDVFWFINGMNVTEHKDIPFIDLRSTVLYDSEWTNRFAMNMEVTCSVRLRFIARSVPSPFYRSNVFFAGLYPETYEYTVIEGEYVDIVFTQTVPVACFTSNPTIQKKFCNKDVYTFQPTKKGPVCSNNIANRDIVFNAKFCGIKLESIDWEEKKYLRVYGFSDGIYNHQDRSTYIRLSTNAISPFHDIWTNLTVPEIKVNVLDKDSTMTGRLCQVYNDPHFRTFDGKVYHYMEVGEFVLYRNSKGPYWVHALFTNCGFGWEGSSCICGVAIRSRSSLFVLRTCEKVSRDNSFPLKSPHSEVRSCNDNDLSIDISHNTYTITLPTGTEIKFTISTWSMLINGISVKPSIFDINEAKGLCGVPSKAKDTSDDFTNRDSGSISDERTFADSWRITATDRPDEQLFIEEPTFLSLDVGLVIDNGNNENGNTTDRYCVCESQAPKYNGDLDLYNIVQCNLTESTETCSSAVPTNNDGVIGSLATPCISTSYSRKKRSVNTGHKIVRRSTSDSDDVLDVKPLEYDDDVNSTKNFTRSFRNGWTEEKANQTCNELIKNKIPTDLEENGIILSEEEYIESCVEDIKLTSDTTFAKDTVSAMQTYTLMEVLRNETMAMAEKDNSTQTVLEYITSFLCPNNCSGNGNCTKGFCTCTNEYAGDDCSQQIYIPPANISLPTAGLCGTRTRACQRTNIYGYFPSRDVWCNKTHFQVNGDSKTYADPVMVKAEYRTAFMVSVALGGNRKKRSTLNTGMAEGYELRLSNDGIEFSDPVSIIIYDEECYDCNSSSISCVVVASCPDFTTTGIESTTERVSTMTQTTTILESTTIEDTTTQETTTIEDTTTQETTTVEDTTTHDTTTIEDTTTQETTTIEDTTTQETTTIEDTTTQETTTIEDTTTHDTTTIEDTTTQETTTIEETSSSSETTPQDTTTQQMTTTDLMTSTRQLTTIIHQSTSDSLTTTNQLSLTSTPDSTPYDTTATDETTTHTDTTQEESDKLISYIGPIIIGGLVLLFVMIFCVIVLIKLIHKKSKPRNKSITQFDSWNIYKGGTFGGSNDKEVNSRPDFRNVPRINTRPSVSSGTSNADGQRNFFNDYCHQ